MAVGGAPWCHSPCQAYGRACEGPAWFPLGEGSGLALAGAGRFVELLAKALVLGLQVANLSLEGLAVGTPDRFHVRIIRGRATRSCADGTQESFSLSLGR